MAFALLAVVIPLLVGSAALFIVSDKPVNLAVGASAPLFTLKDSENKEVALDQFLGKKVVLFFYPRNETSGCTAQVCALRDSYHRYQEEGIVLLGVNYATPKEHASFKEHHRLPFTLLSDYHKEVAKKYGAYRGMLRLLAPARMTFIIDEKGLIKAVLPNVNVKTHAEKIIELCHESV